MAFVTRSLFLLLCIVLLSVATEKETRMAEPLVDRSDSYWHTSKQEERY